MQLVSSSSAILLHTNSQQPSGFDGYQQKHMQQLLREILQSQKVSTSCCQLMYFLKQIITQWKQFVFSCRTRGLNTQPWDESPSSKASLQQSHVNGSASCK